MVRWNDKTLLCRLNHENVYLNEIACGEEYFFSFTSIHDLCHVCFFHNKALCSLLWLRPLFDVSEVMVVCSVVVFFQTTAHFTLTVETLLLDNTSRPSVDPEWILTRCLILLTLRWGKSRKAALFKMQVCNQRDLHALVITAPFCLRKCPLFSVSSTFIMTNQIQPINMMTSVPHLCVLICRKLQDFA